jgi:multidrug efflux system outer membrane protein
VLNALKDAEDSLARFRHGRASVAIVARSKNQAARAAELMAIRQRAGTAALIDVLDTERQQLSAEQNLAQAEGSLTNEFIALQKSLGLGFSKNQALTPSPSDKSSRRQD